MRILLIASSEPAATGRVLARLYPNAQLEIVGKNALAEPTPWQALARLRRYRPDVFAVSWPRLDWPLQQPLYALYGTLLGARAVVFLDEAGQMRRRSRWGIWLEEIPRAAVELLLAPALIAFTWLAVWSWSLIGRPRARPGSGPWLFLRTTPAPATLAGGAATHIRGFLTALVRQHPSLHVLTNDCIPDLSDTIPQTVIPPSARFGFSRPLSDLWNAWRFGARAHRQARALGAACLYQRYSRFNFSGAWLARLGISFLLEYNGSEVWIGRHWDRIGMLWLLERIERFNLQSADLIFVVSEALERELVGRGIPPGRIVVNPNGVDIERFRPDCGGRALRAERGWQNDIVAGFLGTFGPWHGADVLAEAISTMRCELPLRFIFIGAGNLLPEAQQRVRASPWAERVHFLGRIPHEEVPRWLDACDILVSPHVPLAAGTEFFGSPTKLFEYMAMGKAIVASRLGQIEELLTHERTALLVEPGDRAALAAAIERLARDPTLRTRLGVAARQEVAAHYTWEQNAARVLAAFRARFAAP